jgi:hypothetical protein
MRGSLIVKSRACRPTVPFTGKVAVKKSSEYDPSMVCFFSFQARVKRMLRGEENPERVVGSSGEAQNLREEGP